MLNIVVIYRNVTVIEELAAAFLLGRYLGQIILVPINKNNKTEGIVNGHVVDATNGMAVEGAVVKF
ncbi:MAG: hypothetical protein IKP88_01295 [Lachnospiraceae bacterium]|nr:hypothetical protein [Lachnospiraceae bacterium]